MGCRLKQGPQTVDQPTWHKWLIHDTKHSKSSEMQSVKNL